MRSRAPRDSHEPTGSQAAIIAVAELATVLQGANIAAAAVPSIPQSVRIK
jgi:hypothetical protein